MASTVLIVDCQLLQTKAWHRGMGKYTAKLLSAFDAQASCTSRYDDIVLLFNEQLVFEDDLAQFCSSLKHMRTQFLNLATPEDGSQHSITLAQKNNRTVLDDYILHEFPGADINFLISSLFLDEACPTFPSHSHNSLVYYDLIPLMYYRVYLGLGASEQYFTRLSVLFDADKVFAISETVANDIVMYLGVPREKVVNIRGASNHNARSRTSSRPDLSIENPYIMMPTGGDPRKNKLMGVRGFSLFNERNGNKYQLVITSIFTDEQKEELHKYSPDLVFTGNVSDAELWWLYEHAETVLFPTKYEGLGMPILEAIDAQKSIVCSDISVFREISTEAFYMFNPTDFVEIGNAIEEVIVAPKSDIAKKMQEYPEISALYTWESTARIVADGLIEIGRQRPARHKKKKIAIVTPNLCLPSEDARFAALQYATLKDTFDVHFHYDMSNTNNPVRPSFLAFSTLTFDLRQFTKERYDTYDLVVYLIGNSDRSVATLQAALALPGVVILTDNTVRDTYGAARVQGMMPQERIDAEGESFVTTLIDRSLIVVGTRSLRAGLPALHAGANKLAYESQSGRSLYNVLFVVLDEVSLRANEWNINFIKDITENVDESRMRVNVITRTSFSPEVITTLRSSSVTLYEDVTDHEYNTLLTSSDLYVDASPEASLRKTFLADEAMNLGLDVFVAADTDSHGWREPVYYVAKDGNDLRRMTYMWLLGGTEVLRESKGVFTPQNTISLQMLIETSLKEKRNE